MVSCISMSFGIPCTMLTSGHTLACCSPGFTNSSIDSARPTTERTLPGGGGITFTPVGAVDSGAELSAVWALDEGAGLLGVAEFGTVFGVGAVTGEDWIVGADMLEAGLSGDTGDIGLVGLLTDFLQASDVVSQGPYTGVPYGLGQVEERVWIMLPVKPV